MSHIIFNLDNESQEKLFKELTQNAKIAVNASNLAFSSFMR